MYKPEEMPIPSTFNQKDLPDWAQEFQKASSFGQQVPNREQKLREFLALYFGEVKLIDDSVGKIIAALEESGKLENTIIVFTTDHGEYGGEHGLEHKNCLYETAYRIPMIVHWPQGIAKRTKIDRLMSTVDFQPTILALMGVDATGREEGVDGSSFFRGETREWNDTAYLHHNTHTRAGIFTRDYELALVENGEDILFDRINDPDQVINLYNDPAYASVVTDLSADVIAHQRKLDTPAMTWLPGKDTSL
jgi:uncharacterized sulfatase